MNQLKKRMDKTAVEACIQKEQLIGVIRTHDLALAKKQLRFLSLAGLKIIEISSTSMHFKQIVEWSRAELPKIIIGAATVMCKETLQKAISAKVSFVVSPIFSFEIAQELEQSNKLFIPGACSPTEVANIKSKSPDINLIKLFPLQSVNFFEGIKKIFPDTDFLLSGFEINHLEKLIQKEAKFFAIGSYFTENLEESKKRVDYVKSIVFNKPKFSINQLRSLIKSSQSS